MRNIIVTFVIETTTDSRAVGTVITRIKVNSLPVKYSAIKAFAEKDMPSNYRISSLQSVCDVTDLVEFDDEASFLEVK